MVREIALFLWRLSVSIVLITLESVIGIPVLSLAWLLWSSEVLLPVSFVGLVAIACLLYSTLFSIPLTTAAIIVIALAMLFAPMPQREQLRNRLLGVLLGSVLLPLAGGLVFTSLIWMYGLAILLVAAPLIRRQAAKPLRVVLDTQWWRRVQT